MEGSEETEWEVISDKNDSLSVFPPLNHENLQPPPTEDQGTSKTADEHVSDAESDVAEAEGDTESDVAEAEGDTESDVAELEANTESEVAEVEGNKEEGVRRSIKMRMEMARAKLLWVASRIGVTYVVCGGGFWSVTTLAVAAVVLYYKVQRRRWKEREMGLLHLLQEKDERIRQLLLQIGEMKEMLLARRRVPIYRMFAQKNYLKEWK